MSEPLHFCIYCEASNEPFNGMYLCYSCKTWNYVQDKRMKLVPYEYAEETEEE